MTPSWQIVSSTLQANVRGAAYIMDPSITHGVTTLAEADSEKGKSCDGDITPTGPSWKNCSVPLAFQRESVVRVGRLKKTPRGEKKAQQRHVDLFFLCVSRRAVSAKTQT